MKRNILSINKLLTCYKLAIISVLLFISGNALAQQANTSRNTTPIKQDAMTAREDSSQIFGQQTIYPLYPGDQGELLKYIEEQKKLYTPSPSWKAGHVELSFVIDTTGQVCRTKVTRPLTPEQDSIAKRIVDGMPKWSPGGTKDQLREIEYSIPIHFRDIPTE